ncbi:MAG: adenylate/guanylate cyclase domain-containing protein [Abitibacteriaceae bacterium]|nr:adenylate/guanylate cyclase domain-containing protein [Abditibacteriaceae bacterium]MBV9867790.1 adenylate/guanylate cyclase domain-containing protein [Abditibacteriaceae bacterium]
MVMVPDNSWPAADPPQRTGLPLLTDTFQLFDIAETTAQAEAKEWGEDPGLNLFLEDTITLVQRELELMPKVCGARTGERARLFLILNSLPESDIDILAEHYKEVAQCADIYVFATPNVTFPLVQGVQVIPIKPGSMLARERTVIIDSAAFGAALFVHEAGQLETEASNATTYFEGFLTVRPEALEMASRRLCTLLQLPQPAARRFDSNLVTSWYSRLNTRFLETLEGQKLALRAHTRELETLLDEHRRLQTLMRGYVGGKTWKDVQEAVETGHSVLPDWREELTICFCDLVGFTPLSERLNPTEVAAILNDHFSRLHDIVRAHGGWIDKFMGDAMLAVFDHTNSSPADALMAAEKMVRESRKVRVNSLMEVPVAVRVGLNTGLVAVANLGVPEHRERTVLGDVVNFAQRLQSATQPHTILLAEDTFTRLPYSMQRNLQQMDVQVKGKRGTFRAYLWTLHSHRQVSEQSEIRERLLNASRRTPLSDRLGGNNNRNRPEV